MFSLIYGILRRLFGGKDEEPSLTRDNQGNDSVRVRPTPSPATLNRPSNQYTSSQKSNLTRTTHYKSYANALYQNTELPSVTQSTSNSRESVKWAPLSIRPTISLASSNLTNLEEDISSSCPEDFKSLIKKDIVPGVLKKPLSMSTYKAYFQALLYAEDIYLEEWDGLEISNVTLQFPDPTILGRKGESNSSNVVKNVDKSFVAFQIDKIPERLPFLLSRDFVTVRSLINKNKTFQGIIYRVVRSNHVVVEFGEDFHSQHHQCNKYDVKFSFNRVCLKRAHQAIMDASNDLLRNFLFPTFNPNYVEHNSVGVKISQARALERILTLQGAPPYLLEGPLSLKITNELSTTGEFVVAAILKICGASSSNRILLCAPTNKTCDIFMRGLKKGIPECNMFRANAAFRELDGVPIDILPSCLYVAKRECFSCPSLKELCDFKVILSTYMSSVRLHNQGIMTGHFTHIFCVDASSVTEPETLVPLASFANEETTVVVTGAPENRSRWIRSTIARQNGLMISYFERIRKSRLYKNSDPHVITIL